MENNNLMINGVRYSLDDLSKLPPELAPYKASKKSNNQYIAFQGELFPCRNFHRSPFQLDDTCFTSAKQWIQFQKSRLFNDNQMAEEIMQASKPLLGHISCTMEMIQSEQGAKETILGMDHNNDLLKCHIHPAMQEFLNGILENELMPTITRPTRITQMTASLIDNVFVMKNLYNNFD